MKRKTTIYLPLVPRGSLISTSGSPENLLKNLAPVYHVHYENVDVEKSAENMLEKFVFEKRKNLENAIHSGTADHMRNKQYLQAEMAQLLSELAWLPGFQGPLAEWPPGFQEPLADELADRLAGKLHPRSPAKNCTELLFPAMSYSLPEKMQFLA